MLRMRTLLAAPLAALILSLVALGQAEASTTTVNMTTSGQYEISGLHDASNTSYLSGMVVGNPGRMYNNFFVFDLPGLADDITGATLRIYNPANGGKLNGRVYTNYHVSNSISELTANQTNRVDIFDDLGSGIAYGSTTNFAVEDYLTIVLNTAALADLNAARGGSFAIGGALAPVSQADPAALFGFSGGANWSTDRAQLVLEFGPTAVPEPASLVMVSLAAAAGLGLGWTRRRRTAA